MLKEKKTHDGVGNLRGARSCEHGIEQLETELADHRVKLSKELRDNIAAVRALKEWRTTNSARLAELEKEIA